MAIITNNPLLRGARGMFGGVIVFRQLKGRTVMQKPPTPTTLESPVQKQNRSQFAQASAYAKAAMLDPQLKEQYREEAKRLNLPNPYTAALTFKLRDLKALADERKEHASSEKEYTPQTPPRAYPPEPFQNMNLKEYMLNSTTTGKRSRRKYKATLPRPIIRPSPEMLERLLHKTKESSTAHLPAHYIHTITNSPREDNERLAPTKSQNQTKSHESKFRLSLYPQRVRQNKIRTSICGFE